VDNRIIPGYFKRACGPRQARTFHESRTLPEVRILRKRTIPTIHNLETLASGLRRIHHDAGFKAENLCG